jgi:7-keto-8-aminopelargonate synthetase-like enzyme
MDLFASRRLRTIWQAAQTGRELGLLQLDLDDQPLTGRTVHIGGRELVSFASCSYLGLERDPRVIAGAVRAARRYGTAFSASRSYLSASPYRELEDLTEEIFGGPVWLATTTTLAHLSFFDVAIQPGDVILLDRQVHNSVQLTARTVADRARVVTVGHNDVERLAHTVAKHLAKPATRHVWYCGDGVYSMFGDVAPVAQLAALLEREERFHCYLDDAHGTSTQGLHGRGYVLSELDRLPERMVLAVSLAKGFGMGGGALLRLPSETWRDVLRSCGPTAMFSGPLAPPVLGAGVAAARIHLSRQFPGLLAELHERIAVFRETAQRLGLELLSSSRSPVQYLRLGSFELTLGAAERLMAEGFLACPSAYPAVGLRDAGLRFTITRHQRLEDLAAVLEVVAAHISS